jgi:threonine synthase
MIKYVSTKGGISPVAFDEVVLSGFAADGGLFVPENIPRISEDQFQSWSTLSFTDLAFEILSLFIPRSIIPDADLKTLIEDSYSSFERPDVVDLVSLCENNRIVVMELFHGPTLSFKDVAMGFLINFMDYLLEKSFYCACDNRRYRTSSSLGSSRKKDDRLLATFSSRNDNRGTGTTDDDIECK